MPQALAGSIIQADMGRFNVRVSIDDPTAVGQFFCFDGKTVVLGRDLDVVGGQIFDRVIRSVVAKF